jgi:hypothetical protein
MDVIKTAGGINSFRTRPLRSKRSNGWKTGTATSQHPSTMGDHTHNQAQAQIDSLRRSVSCLMRHLQEAREGAAGGFLDGNFIQRLLLFAVHSSQGFLVTACNGSIIKQFTCRELKLLCWCTHWHGRVCSVHVSLSVVSEATYRPQRRQCILMHKNSQDNATCVTGCAIREHHTQVEAGLCTSD